MKVISKIVIGKKKFTTLEFDICKFKLKCQYCSKGIKEIENIDDDNFQKWIPSISCPRCDASDNSIKDDTELYEMKHSRRNNYFDYSTYDYRVDQLDLDMRRDDPEDIGNYLQGRD